MKKFGYPFVKIIRGQVAFLDGRYCNLPFEYTKSVNEDLLTNFYTYLLSKGNSSEIISGIDPLGFTYVLLDFICYVGLVSESKEKGKYRKLSKRYPRNKFHLEYLQKQIQFEYDLLNFKEFIPIEIVTQNLHEIRGLNSKIAGNVDLIMNVKDESDWDSNFESQSESIKKIYVGSRLIKFILDNVKFYIPDFFDNLKLNYDRSFVVHRSVSKIVKIYRNDFKRDRADIEFKGTCRSSIKGDKEYFEILVKILIENALKYSEFPKKIGPKVILAESNRRITLEVQSYGRAIPKVEEQSLFIKGFRSSANRSSKEGTGMGLFNARQLSKHFNSVIEFKCVEVSKENNIDLAWNIFTLVIRK